MKRVVAVLLSVLTVFIVSVYLYFGSVSAATCFVHTEAFARSTCLNPYFENITYKKSADKAVSKAYRLQQLRVIGTCHLPAHNIGEANLHKYSDDVGTALATCSYECLQGCVHGVMESYISHHTSPDSLTDEIDVLCQETETDSLLHRQCVHGVGHGLLAHGYLPINDAIDMCYAFSSDFDQETCLGGLFMENVDQYLSNTENLLKQRLAKICTDVSAQDLLDDCFVAVGEGMMFYTGHDLEKSDRLCEVVASQYVEICKAGAKTEFDTNQLEKSTEER